MGLDMYLTGEKYLPQFNRPKNDIEREDGFRIKARELDLGYWRKHPDLHGFIINTFADGVDECQRIPISAEEIEQVIFAIENDQLPKTTGFFFGESENDAEQKEEAIGIFKLALEWLLQEDDTSWRTVIYQASW